MAARSTLPDVAIVGLGNWGTSLAAALLPAQIPLREVVVRKPRRSSLPLVSWKKARLDARLIWLCVPDAAIADAAEKIARLRPSLTGQIVVHSSGALTVSALDAVRRTGAQVASVHPAMTFPTRDVVPLDGVLFGIEAEHAATRRLLHALVRRIGGSPFDLSSKDKPMYHAAGTLASPLLVSALTSALEAARRAGLDEKTSRRWVQALAGPTIRNVFARGADKSFSGPFARGDAETIRLHLNALQPHPILAAVYRSLAQQALQSLPVKNAGALSAALQVETQMKQAGRSGTRTTTRSKR
jgi:predicted short-subunit dehydrogenase-like oxidoreductase (DUF2520 family)